MLLNKIYLVQPYKADSKNHIFYNTTVIAFVFDTEKNSNNYPYS